MNVSDGIRGEILLGIARAALEERLAGREPSAPPEATWLEEPGAVFVTLMLAGELRGCIGSLEATRTLREDLRWNALAAALRDPRFPPLSASELAGVRIEVSLLGAAEPLEAGDEAAAIAALDPGVDGVLLEHPTGRGTFLPQVWEQLPEPADFLRHLKRKAGLPMDGWDAGYRLSRYHVRKWSEEETDR